MRQRSVILTAAAVGLMVLAGCGKDEAGRGPASRPSTSEAATTLPDIPDLDETAVVADGPLVKARPDEQRKDRYTLDEKAYVGSLRITCRIPSVRATLPDLKAVDFTGPCPIKDPMAIEPYKVIYDGIRQQGYDIKNEVEFYRDWNPPCLDGPLRWLAPAGQHMAVEGAAIIIEGIKSGPREELVRGQVLMNHRYWQGNYIHGRNNYSGYNIAFVPPDQRIVLGTGDHFPCEIAITEHDSGRGLGEPFRLPPLALKREGSFTGWLYEANAGSWGQPGPGTAPSPTFREMGVYTIRCLRHPWHVGYAIVVDNPYVAVSGAQQTYSQSRDGRVTIAGVPVGTWKVRIWHPLIEPVQPVHEVKIETDEIAHLIVDFKPPKELLSLVK
ncbi:MAG TPA: hypothetical protein VFJ30_16220 [Phycisphaerae bacterium]|nr:hypothetical protein [Phycisphaerae bacterium]